MKSWLDRGPEQLHPWDVFFVFAYSSEPELERQALSSLSGIPLSCFPRLDGSQLPWFTERPR